MTDTLDDDDGDVHCETKVGRIGRHGDDVGGSVVTWAPLACGDKRLRAHVVAGRGHAVAGFNPGVAQHPRSGSMSAIEDHMSPSRSNSAIVGVAGRTIESARRSTDSTIPAPFG